MRSDKRRIESCRRTVTDSDAVFHLAVGRFICCPLDRRAGSAQARHGDARNNRRRRIEGRECEIAAHTQIS